MDVSIGYAAFAVITAFFLGVIFAKRHLLDPKEAPPPLQARQQSVDKSIKQSTEKVAKNQDSPKDEEDKSKQPFEKYWKTGKLHCDGTLCNPKGIHCIKPEILLCRDIISELIANGNYKGQVWFNQEPLQYSTRSRRVDFAIETSSESV